MMDAAFFMGSMRMRCFTAAGLPVFLGAALLVGGCGESAPQGGSNIQGVVASATDCVSFGPGAVDACARAIERAVERHEESTTTYTDRAACEAVVGEGKCERSASGMYRPRLSAFRVTIGAAPAAEPLYPTNDGTVGFLTASKTVLPASDRKLGFSRLALSVAELQASSSKKKRASRF